MTRIETFVDLFNQRRLAEALSTAAPGYRYDDGSSGPLDRTEHEALMAAVLAIYPDRRITLLQVAATGRQERATYLWQGTCAGTGRRVEAHWQCTLRYDEQGRVVSQEHERLP